MRMDTKALLLLLNWMSPAFPIGAYAYSHGLEWAIEQGEVKSKAEVEAWITDLLTRGSGWNDAVFFALSYEQDVNELALALCSSRERYMETTQLGAAFESAVQSFGVNVAPPPQGRRAALAYPVAAARACKAMGISCDHALLAFLQGFSNALISVAVRLVPIGQTAGLEVMRDVMPVISSVATRAQQATVADLGSCTVLSDIAAIKHETQYSRIFRS